MGNWHCIPSSCAEVVYQEYEPPKIRWRYPGFAWQEIIGDNYTVNTLNGQCNTTYLVKGIAAKNGVNYCETPNLNNNWSLNVPGPIHGLKALFARQDDRYSCPNYTSIVGKANLYLAYINFGSNPNDSSKSIIYFYEPHTISDVVKITSIARTDGQPDNCGGCEFTITKKGQIIYQETRSVCPEVEKISCKLSDQTKRIEIEKLPYLERIEVRDQSINTVFVSPNQAPLIDTKPLPSNCLNVYQTYILAAPLLSNFVPLPGFINPYQFVAQICSYPGCPPPQYQVLCDSCGCESCPGDTCPIECGDHICCYNDYGISVAQIPKLDYCGGTK